MRPAKVYVIGGVVSSMMEISGYYDLYAAAAFQQYAKAKSGRREHHIREDEDSLQP